MTTVTRRIAQTKQPRGGYLPLRDFQIRELDGNAEILSPENINPGLVGAAVDYLTRLVTGTDPRVAFEIPLLGALFLDDDAGALELIGHLDGLTDDSIVNACRLAGYDVAYRVGPEHYKPVHDIEPDQSTIKNIRAMIERMVAFLEVNTPIIDGFDLEGGYTDIINAGDGDLLTTDTLWDIKTSRKKPQPKDTLQILIYWIMGLHSVHPEFQALDHLGIINPRLGKVWSFAVADIPDDVRELVSTEVIGYHPRLDTQGIRLQPAHATNLFSLGAGPFL